jgi:transcriptional regulator with XRE-family HTH domain
LLNSTNPKNRVTPGDHIRKRRLDLGLLQKEVAVAAGVDTMRICNWEKGRSGRQPRFIPRIIRFLGYEPECVKPLTLGERIKRHRTLRGISQKELARQIGIDPTTLSRLERNRGKCLSSILRKVEACLDRDGRRANLE